MGTFEMDGARGNNGRMDSFSAMKRSEKVEEELDEVDDDVGVQEEPDVVLPPLVNIQNRTSQPMNVNPSQGITVSLKTTVIVCTLPRLKLTYVMFLE